MKKLFYLLSFIILAGFALFIFILNYKEKPAGCGVKDPVFICGTSNGVNSEEAFLGKSIFKANCAACHKLDKNMTGPALREMGKKYDTTILIKFIRGEKSLIKSKDYNSPCVNFPKLSDKDISDLLHYTN
ncbi:cytochrome c [Olleya aquimaris]|uniref:Cytochrome c n=1 Tax=Olleya aquimaris TaxID=639310 RepID=A0A327RN98_9FLAO|nr:cytochrome c [Olleya aquimaris]RAJ17971.1 cytochrome c [Olleya aquimaris]